ncbi:unnamed protein product [Arabidopsis halleri]
MVVLRLGWFRSSDGFAWFSVVGWCFRRSPCGSSLLRLLFLEMEVWLLHLVYARNF